MRGRRSSSRFTPRLYHEWAEGYAPSRAAPEHGAHLAGIAEEHIADPAAAPEPGQIAGGWQLGVKLQQERTPGPAGWASGVLGFLDPDGVPADAVEVLA